MDNRNTMKWITPLFALLLCVSCGSVKYVPVESVRTETLTETRVDTVYISKQTADLRTSVVKDSVAESVKESTTIVVSEKGDTLRTDYVKEVVRDRKLKEDNERLLAELDSLKSVGMQERIHIVTDSVAVPYPVEKPLTRWQAFKQDVGGIAIGVAVAMILAVAGVLVYRRMKK